MKKPNILLFVTDQQHAETIGEAGLARTPRLNGLIREGVRFTEAYTPTPMCTPARGSLVTGLYPHQHKLVINTHGTDAEHYTIAGIETIGSAVQSAGYRTAYAGKWHVGKTPPELHGFQEELSLPEAGSKGKKSDVVTVPDLTGEELLAATAGYEPKDAYVFRLARTVNEWLRQTASDDRPFLLMASCNEPHVPWVVPEPYASMYDAQTFPQWDSYNDGFEGRPITYTKHYTNVNFCRLQNDWPKMSRALAKYYGAVTMVDDAFGTIIDTLEETCQLDNTVVIFTSDHGELLGRNGLIGKNELALDNIIRVPFVVYWRGHFVPGECDEFIHLCDVFNTIMELAGIEGRAHLDSRSLLPYLDRKPNEGHKRHEVFIQHGGTTFPNNVRAVRNRKYKYVFRPHEIDELYDLELDPSERVNRISDPAYKEIIDKLRMRLIEWAEETRDPSRGSMKLVFRNPDQPEFQLK